MLIHVCLELNNDERAIAWALDYPGCFAYGNEPEGTDAVMALPQALVAYEDWVNRRGGPGTLDLGDFDVRLAETFTCFPLRKLYQPSQAGYIVESFFSSEWKPMQAADVAQALRLLEWSRADLLHTLEDLTDAQLDATREGERWPIRGVLRHISGAEWWYMESLGLVDSSREALPKDEMEQLAFVRERLRSVLPTLAGKELVIGKLGELWSPRKLLRRALWHELDHIMHILKLRY